MQATAYSRASLQTFAIELRKKEDAIYEYETPPLDNPNSLFDHCTALLSPQPSRFCDVGGKGSGDKWVEDLPTSDGGRSV
jgi:hypothetical protein